MSIMTLEARARALGKKAARRVRREGGVPCVLYGHHVDPVHFQVPALPLKRLAFGRSANRVEVTLDGEAWSCVLKVIDLHPITDEPIHADFQVLQEGERIRITVPIRFVGTPAGQKEGGDTQHILTQLDVICFPKDIPAQVEVDVTELDIGEAIHVSDLELENVEIEMNPQQTIVTVVAPTIEPVEPEEPVLTLEELEEGEMVEAPEGEEEVGLEEGEEGEDFEEDL